MTEPDLSIEELASILRISVRTLTRHFVAFPGFVAVDEGKTAALHAQLRIPRSVFARFVATKQTVPGEIDFAHMRFYTIEEVSAIVGLSLATATKRFPRVPGVIDLGKPETLHKRRFSILRIPRSAVQRYKAEKWERERRAFEQSLISNEFVARLRRTQRDEVTIFVRHSRECRHRDDAFFKGCLCRKHLRWFHKGRLFRKSTKTRDWRAAERVKEEVESEIKHRNNLILAGLL